MPFLDSQDLQNQVHTQLSDRAKAMSTLTQKHEKAITARKAELDASMDQQVSGSSDSTERSQIKNIMGRQNKKVLSQMRRDAVAATEADRQAILSKVSEYEESISTTESLFHSPIQVLGRAGLTKPETPALLANLRGAGNAELESTAQLAIATGDKILAAAVLNTADRGGKKYSQFDKPAFAEQMVGAEVTATRAKLQEMRTAVEALRTIDRSFRNGVHSSKDRIKAGLAARALKTKEQTRLELGKQLRGTS